MKKPLLLLLLGTSFLVISCTKSWFENRLEGQWRLEKAERTSFINWNDVPTGYESGTFTFFGDGSVTYEDRQLNMRGDWMIRRRTDQYRDSDGDDQQDVTYTLSIHLYDFSAGKVLNLDFDKMVFRGKNRFLGKYQTPGYRYRYEFARY